MDRPQRMHLGVVRYFNNEKGYGFIREIVVLATQESLIFGDMDIYLCAGDLRRHRAKYAQVLGGELVQYRLTETERGLRATDPVLVRDIMEAQINV